MYVNSEKELEDYICKNIDNFIYFLKDTFNIDRKIEFVGRQVVIGDSRIDLLFQTFEESKLPKGGLSRIFIVVELKYRYAEPKDVSQLSRYMNLLHSLSFSEKTGDNDVFVKGLLLTLGLNDDMQEVQMYLNDYTDTEIIFASIQTNINYTIDSYSRKEEYLESMTIDDRLKLAEVKEYGKEKNGRP